jgi:hypothetical protein
MQIGLFLLQLALVSAFPTAFDADFIKRKQLSKHKKEREHLIFPGCCPFFYYWTMNIGKSFNPLKYLQSISMPCQSLPQFPKKKGSATHR